MNPNDTERLARWLWPDAEWTYCVIGLYREVGERVAGKQEIKVFSPSTDLNDCALAWEVLAERGLLDKYHVALYNEYHNVNNPLDLDVMELQKPALFRGLFNASSPQHAAALLAVCDAQGGE